VLASLWKVPDAETERLMGRFFQLWLGGMGKAQALRQAQLELIAALRQEPDETRQTAPPVLWAGFILNGEPGEVRMADVSMAAVDTPAAADGPGWPWWLCGGVLLVGLLAGLGWWARRWRTA
jgi:hypothetical protein